MLPLNSAALSNICIHQRHDEIGWRITLADTGEKSLKGARLKKIQKYISEDMFMATYGDGIANIDIKALLAFHQRHGKIGHCHRNQPGVAVW